LTGLTLTTTSTMDAAVVAANSRNHVSLPPTAAACLIARVVE